jgi:hypothetical protein
MRELRHPGMLEPLSEYLLVPTDPSTISEFREAQTAVQWLAASAGAKGLLFLGNMERDLNTLHNQVYSHLDEYASQQGREWFEKRRPLAAHLLDGEPLRELGAALTGASDSYVTSWTGAVLHLLRSEAVRLNRSAEVDAIDQMLSFN